MGLEVAEILLDLENEFIVAIELPKNSEEWDGTVGGLTEIVCRIVNNAPYASYLDALSSYKPETPMNKSNCKAIEEFIPQLQIPLLGTNRVYPSVAHLTEKLQQLSVINGDRELRRSVKAIIKKTLCLRELPNDADNLFKDLGCG